MNRIINFESYTVSESEEILREIKEVKKVNPNDPLLKDLWDEYWNAIESESDDYTRMLMKVMK